MQVMQAVPGSAAGQARIEEIQAPLQDDPEHPRLVQPPEESEHLEAQQRTPTDEPTALIATGENRHALDSDALRQARHMRA